MPVTMSTIRVLAGLALLTACTNARPASAPSSLTSAPPATPSPSVDASGPFIRTCESSVYGDLGKDWRQGSLVVGPVAFVGLGAAATAQPSAFEPLQEGIRAVKVLAVVNQGSEVTVSVSSRSQPHVSLLYDPAGFKEVNAYLLSEGQSAVTFQACSAGQSPFGNDGPTQFNGGFIVDGAQCADLEVRAPGTSVRRVSVAFGRGSCTGSS